MVMRQILLYSVACTLALSGIVLLGRGFYRMHNRKPLVAAPASNASELLEVQKRDEKILNDGTARPDELAKALRRISEQGAPRSAALVKQYLRHRQVEVRAAAVEAVALLPEKGLWGEIESAFDSAESELRMAAVRAAVARPRAGAMKRIRQLLDRPDISADERLLVYLGISRLADNDLEKNAAIQFVINDKGASENARAQAMTDLLRYHPGRDDLVELAKKEASASSSVKLEFEALLYLSNHGKSWLKDNLRTFANSKNRRTQNVIIDFLATNCAKDWRGIVNGLKKNGISEEAAKSLDEAELNLRCAFE